MQVRQRINVLGKHNGNSILLIAYGTIPKYVVVWTVFQSLQLLQGSTFLPLPV